MNMSSFYKTAFGLSLGGTLFAGYLSFYKYFLGSCAFNEPCPTFIGYPSCWFGFGLFAILLMNALVGLLKEDARPRLLRPILATAVAGTLFAGWFTLQEILAWLSGAGIRYALGLPTCAYGLVFFLALAVLTARQLKSK